MCASQKKPARLLRQSLHGNRKKHDSKTPEVCKSLASGINSAVRTRDIYYFTNTKNDGWSEGPRKSALELKAQSNSGSNQPVKMSIHHRCFLLLGLPNSTPGIHRRRAESILARALIWPFCTFLTPSPSSLPLLKPIPPRSVVLVEASLRRCSGDF